MTPNKKIGSKRFRTFFEFLVAFIIIFVTSLAFVSALNVKLWESKHNSTLSLSILSASASDGIGVKELKLYEDGLSENNLIASKDCGYSYTCSLTKTVQHVEQGSHTFYAVAKNKAGSTATATLTIYFEGVNRPPQITSKNPASDVVSINEGSSQTFSIIANDPDGDVLSYSWTLDGNQVSTSTSFTYSPNYFSSGQHSISVTVSDSKATASTSWSVYVNNVLIPTSCSLSFSKSSPISYTQQPFTAYCSCNSQEASARLSRNGQDVTNEIGKAVTLPAGSYSYVCSVQQTANYAGSSTSATFVINKATTSLMLDALPSWNVDEGTQTTVSCSANNNEVLLSLYRNSLQVTSGYGSISEIATLPAGSYVYVCNTTGSQNYTSANTSNTLTVSALPDTTPPVVNIISPENITYSTSWIELNYTATDNIAISSCWYDLNGNITQLPGCQNATLTLSDGFYTLTVYANDTSGNVGSAQVAFTIITVPPDTEPPTINFIIDAPDPVTQGNNITFTANVTDNVAVDTVLIEIQGTNYTMSNIGNGLWEFVFNTSSLAPGIYSYVVYANDTSGNVATAAGDFNVSVADVQAPTVTLISPSNGSTNGPDVTLAYNVSDDTDALLNCSLWTNVTGTWQVSSSKTTPNGSTDSFTLSGLPDGTYIWNVECIDDAGNAAFAPSNFTYIVNTTIPDTNAPTVELIFPSDGETINSPNETVVWNVTDDVDLLLDCEVYSNTSGAWQVDYTTSVPNASNGSYTFTDLPQGTYIWNVRCWDDAGNAAFADQNWSFTVAIVAPNQPPQITLNLPEDNAVFYVQDINFNFTATDDYSPTLSCSIYLDGNLNQTNDSVQNGTLTNFLIEGISYGTHQWYVNCSDGELSSVSEVRSFSIVSAVANWPVFSEVLYDAINEPSGEWIELYNPTSQPVDISGWMIEDNGGNWTIPSGTVINAGQFITIARNATEFYNMYGCLPHLTYNKRLNNAGDDWLRLYNGSIEIDMVRWENASVGWPIYANENKSIQRRPPWQDTNTSADWINDSLPTPACIQPTYSVDVWADSYYKQISRGQNATYLIYINNTGNVVNTFNLTVQNFDNADVAELNISTITLNPGQVGTALLVVSDFDVGTYNVTVTAIDSDDPSVYDITDNITTVVINNAPVANNDSYSVDEDNQLVIDAPGVLANDTDADGDALTAILITNVSNGTLIFNANGSFTYIPNPNFNGIDSFTYVASDGIDNSSVANVTIVVNPVNDAPIALDDNYTTNEDVPLTIPALGVLANDSDIENDPLTAILVTDVTNGTLTLNPDGSFTYIPNANWYGVDSFTYVANDGSANSSVATVTITVNPVNDAPTTTGIPNQTLAEDTNATIDISPYFNDVDGDTLTFSITEENVFEVDCNIVNGTYLEMIPALNWNGLTTCTVQASDGNGGTVDAIVNINVTPVNDAPVANDDYYTMYEDTTLSVSAPGILANDTDVENDNLSVRNCSIPPHVRSFACSANGFFTYTPESNYYGEVTFTYQAYDGQNYSNIATVHITIIPVNDAPVANNDSYSVDEDNVLSVPAPGVLANDTDVENDSLSAVLVTNVVHGSLALNSNGSFVYVPDPDFNGVDSFTYVASDGQNNSNIATVTITINPVPDYSVSIVSDSYYKEVGLLQPATYLINITNTGDTADNYTLSVNNISGADHADLNETTISNLAPGQSYIVSLTVSDSNPGIYNVTVTATSNSNSSVSNTTPIITTNVTTTDSGWIFETSWIDGQNYTDQSTGIFNNINDTFIRMSNITNTNITGNPGNASRANITNSTLNNSVVQVPVGMLRIENSSICNVLITDEGDPTKTIIINNQIIPCGVGGEIGSLVENNTMNLTGPWKISRSNVTNNYLEGGFRITNYSEVNNSKIIWSNISNSTVFDSTIRNSTVNDSTVTSNSVIDNSTITGGSEITNSNLTNSTADNSTITNSTLNGSNVTDSAIINSNLTGSDVTGSQVTNSTLTNSIVDNSTIENSTLTNSTATDSNLTNVNATNSAIENSTLQNATLIDANLTNGVLYNGTIITQNFTYNATGNGPLNLSNGSALPAVNLSIATPGPYYEDTLITFNAVISGQFDLANNVTYWWDWTNDGTFDYSKTTNATSDLETHVYGKGSYTIKVKVNDTHGTSAWDTVSFIVRQKYVREEGGGGGGAGAAANVTNVTNATQPILTQPQPQPQPPKPTMLISNDGLVIIKLGEETKVYSDGEEINISQVKIEKLEGDELKLVPLPQDVYLIRVYKITPPVKFSEDVMLVVKYKEHLVPDANLFVYVYDKGWRKLEVVWDKENKQLVGLVNSATLVGLFTDKLEYKKTWTAAVVGWLETNWDIPVIGVLGLIIVISATALVIKRRR
jgi:VCBS repeat-containing protein